MTDTILLSLVKSNLTIRGGTWDTYLLNLIAVSKKEITREGITLDVDSVDDCNLVVMYTAYLYRKRAEDVAAMPRMLRYALNNRIFSEKGQT